MNQSKNPVTLIHTAGDGGTATAGDRGTATAGYGGTATAGDGGVIVIEYYDGGNYIKKCAMVDNINIIAGQKYRIVNDEFKQINDTL